MTLPGTRYEARLLELRGDPECTVIERADGIVIFAPVAGAHDVIKLHLLLGDAVLLRMLPQARMIIAEVPEDAPFQQMADVLRANDFVVEGRIPDFVADGISVSLLVRRSGSPSDRAPGDPSRPRERCD